MTDGMVARTNAPRSLASTQLLQRTTIGEGVANSGTTLRSSKDTIEDCNDRYKNEKASSNLKTWHRTKQSVRKHYKNPRSFSHLKGGSQGSSSGCSSSDSVKYREILPIEEDERKAIDIIREAAALIRQEDFEYRRKSKALRRKIIPHYECLTGAMVRREQIQHDSYEKHGDRHAIDSHKEIFGHKKDEETALKERMIHLAKWLLKNPVDDQVEYNADEEIQLSEESKDDHSDANK